MGSKVKVTETFAGGSWPIDGNSPSKSILLFNVTIVKRCHPVLAKNSKTSPLKWCVNTGPWTKKELDKRISGSITMADDGFEVELGRIHSVGAASIDAVVKLSPLARCAEQSIRRHRYSLCRTCMSRTVRYCWYSSADITACDRITYCNAIFHIFDDVFWAS